MAYNDCIIAIQRIYKNPNFFNMIR